MERKRFFMRMFAITMIGAGFLSFTVGAESRSQHAPTIQKVVKWVSFPGDGKAFYEVNSRDGCIEKFFYKNGDQISSVEKPHWFMTEKKAVDFGSFTDTECRQGVIAIGNTPIEYWGYANGWWYCIGAYDGACSPPAWYQPCRDSYPDCSGD
jgi:hypothetical protein